VTPNPGPRLTPCCRLQHLEDVKRDVAGAASSSTVQHALATERTLYTQVEATVRGVEKQLVTVMARLDAEQKLVAGLRHAAGDVGGGGGAAGADGGAALLLDIDAKLARGQAQYADAVGLLREEILSQMAAETQAIGKMQNAILERLSPAAAVSGGVPQAPASPPEEEAEASTPAAEEEEEEAAPAAPAEHGEGVAGEQPVESAPTVEG
jgi:hypothetical protein